MSAPPIAPAHLLPSEDDLQRLIAWRLAQRGYCVQREVIVRAHGHKGDLIGKADLVTTGGPDEWVKVYEVKVSLTRHQLFAAVGQVLAYAGGLEQAHPTRSIVPYVTGLAAPGAEVLYEAIGQSGVVNVKALTWKEYRALLRAWQSAQRGIAS